MEKIRKEILWEGVHHYDLEILDDSYILYYSNEEYWSISARNTVALQLVNTGNGFDIIGLGKKGKLDYSEATALYILLAVEKNYKVEIIESKREL